jgi:lactate dehydrogenase-like 2-hydroxyacid dehydrogenase
VTRHTVLYQGTPSQALRELMLSAQPPEFADLWLDDADPEEVRRGKLAEAEFLVGGRVDQALLDGMPRLRMIQLGGVGYEHVDVEACDRRGVPVAITPEGTVTGVAEHTVMMMLAIYKHLAEAHAALKRGEWVHDRLRPLCLMLEEKRVGIVGMGRIGREVARRLGGFDVETVYHDIRPLSAEDEARYGARWLELDELLSTSDVVTLHVFLGPGSKHLIGRRELELMKPRAVLINTSRGDVVDEAALYRHLAAGKLYGAGIDAWQEEPTSPENPILRLENVLVTPHMATANRDAVVKKSRAAYANFQRVLRGEQPINTVRPYKALEEERKQHASVP